jgi:pyridoxine 5-phosphate synthase
VRRSCLEAGAQGITMHPRPDERHIRGRMCSSWPSCSSLAAAEFNIEGNPTQNLMDFIRQVRPHQATFVPDSEDQFTSDHGWSFPQDAERLRR